MKLNLFQHMNKNLFLRLCLMIGVFSIVFSCKTELVEDENTNPTTQNAIAKQILFKELQQQAPQIAKKVSKFSPVDISARTYTDSENDFSIDTEKSLYIEDAKGNKTYTFKMTRAEHNEAVLENLVLKDIGNGEFEAYIATYDSYALQNYSNLSLEDVKNHITMVYVGDRLGSDIFGKANASQCYVTIFTGTTDVYVPGTWCYSGEHNYSHIDDCDYLLKHKAGPTQGYFTTASTFDTYDMCQSGGGSAGSGDGSGVSTSPYGYNGSGGGISSVNDPCVVAQPAINAANGILHSTAGQNMDTTLKGKANAPNEWAMAIGQLPSTSYEVTPAVEGSQHSSTAPTGLLSSTYVADGHAHSGDPAVPSAGDLYGMLEILANSSNTLNFTVSFVYGMSGGTTESYALVVSDPFAANTFLTQYPRSQNYDPVTHGFLKDSDLWNEIEKMKIIFNNKSTAIDTSGENYEPRAVGLAYMMQKLGAGIIIAKADANGNLKKMNATTEKIPNVNDERAKVSKCP